jgi:hypothetical protein
MVESLPPSPRVQDFLDRMRNARRARILFGLDATGSRQPTWDISMRLQSQMFDEAGKLGTLDVQLVYFRGVMGHGGECNFSKWTSDTHELANLMARIVCRTGETQILRVLEHARKEHQRSPINAVVYIGDHCEEPEQTLYDATAALHVPVFVFQEDNDVRAALAKPIFQEMARLSRGAYFQFRPGAERELADALRAVAAFAAGGLTALQNMKTEAATKLLGQMQKKE